MKGKYNRNKLIRRSISNRWLTSAEVVDDVEEGLDQDQPYSGVQGKIHTVEPGLSLAKFRRDRDCVNMRVFITALIDLGEIHYSSLVLLALLSLFTYNPRHSTKHGNEGESLGNWTDQLSDRSVIEKVQEGQDYEQNDRYPNADDVVNESQMLQALTKDL